MIVWVASRLCCSVSFSFSLDVAGAAWCRCLRPTVCLAQSSWPSSKARAASKWCPTSPSGRCETRARAPPSRRWPIASAGFPGARQGRLPVCRGQGDAQGHVHCRVKAPPRIEANDKSLRSQRVDSLFFAFCRPSDVACACACECVCVCMCVRVYVCACVRVHVLHYSQCRSRN